MITSAGTDTGTLTETQSILKRNFSRNTTLSSRFPSPHTKHMNCCNYCIAGKTSQEPWCMNPDCPCHSPEKEENLDSCICPEKNCKATHDKETGSKGCGDYCAKDGSVHGYDCTAWRKDTPDSWEERFYALPGTDMNTSDFIRGEIARAKQEKTAEILALIEKLLRENEEESHTFAECKDIHIGRKEGLTDLLHAIRKV